MKLDSLERWQVGIYLVAIIAGLVIGSAAPAPRPMFEALLWPTLVLLLYVTFIPVPLLKLRDAFGDRRFVAATLVGNFLLVPVLVFALLLWLPPDPALRLGVPLMPCTAWFITFTQLGRGDLSRAIAVTPPNLVLQLLLLPVYLWLFGAAGIGELETLAPATLPGLAFVLLPLVLAAVCERWIEARPECAALRDALAWWPVPLLALVVLVIAAAQVAGVAAAVGALREAVPIFVAYLVLAALAARALAAC